MSMTYEQQRNDIIGALMPTPRDWSAVLHEESEIFDRVMELMAKAHDEGVLDGFFETDPTNPYRRPTDD